MARLIVLDGPNRGAVMSLIPGQNRIGRDPALEIPLPDKSISRRHAILTVDDSGSALADLGSTNATYLNGIRVIGNRPIGHGDEIRFGETITLFLGDEAAAPEARPLMDQSAHSETSKIELSGRTPPVRTAMLHQGAPEVEEGRAVASGTRARYLVGNSPALVRVSELIARCAPLESNVLILGESGAGKELVAEALHRLANRKGEPFVVVNCANLEPALLESELFGHERGSFTGAVARKIGKLELVRSGTLFLDEVGELPLDAQAKLLRALDRREFQRVGGNETIKTAARFVAATHRDLGARVREGRFREDLLFRMRVIEIKIPPLRERIEDMEPIARHLLFELRERIPTPVRTIGADALAALRAYPFPGNVRELKNIIERCLIFCDHAEVGLADLPAEVRDAAAGKPPAPVARKPMLPSFTPMPGASGTPTPANGYDLDPLSLPSLGEGESGEETQLMSIVGKNGGPGIATLAEVERQQIQRALEATGGNKSRAARLLGIDRNTLAAKLKRHGFEGPE